MPTPQPPQTPKQLSGPVQSVPCPHCGHKNDLRGETETLDAGSEYDCDRCHHVMEVVGVRQVKMVVVRQSPNFRGPVKAPQPVQPATTIHPSRILRRR